MARLIHSTSTTLRGPWWLDGESLHALDDILTEERDRLERAYSDRREQMIEAALSKATMPDRSAEAARQVAEANVDLRIKPDRPSLTIRIFATKDQHATAGSFEEARRSEGLSDFAPVGFDIRLKGDGVDASVTLTPDYSDHDLRIRVSPETDQRSRELFVLLRNWADTHRPALLLSLVWTHLAPIFSLIVVFSFVAATVWFGDTKGGLRKEARQLLERGIQDDVAQRRAVEIILQYESDFVRTPVRTPANWVFWTWLAGLAFLLTVVWWTPGTILGIAKGQSRIRRWRAIHRAIFVTVPVGLMWIAVKKLLDSVLG